MDDKLLAAAAAGAVAAITAALDGGANVDARDATGRTALLAATMAGRIDVRALLSGADVDLQDDRRTTRSSTPVPRACSTSRDS
jgi:ankyrin repeat protein